MSNSSNPSLLIIGDSIALGAAEVRGTQVVEYVQPTCIDLLKAAMPMLEVRIDAQVRRNSASVRQEIDKIIARHQPRRALLMIGGSDADMDWRRFVLTDGKVARSVVPVDRYENNLRLICRQLLSAGATPILMDMPNHHFVLRGPYISKIAGKDITPLLERGGGQAESDKHLVLYRAAVAGVAADLNLELVRFGEALDAHPPQSVLSADGAHPNAAGHRLIAQTLIAALSQPAAAAELSA
jgi:lysophospholipase L1-like esterase